MKLTTPLIVLAAALATTAGAATINWTTATAATEGAFLGDLSTGLFNTTGTLVSAENVGGAATNFDGISFDAGTTTFAGGTDNSFHINGPSQTGTYGVNGAADTVNLSGLVIGLSYRVQALVFDGRGDVGVVGRTVEFDGTDLGQYASGTFGVDYGTGMLATGTFVADATTQDFTIESFDGTDSKGGQLNALTVYQVPEPTSTSLLGLAGLALILRRRK